MNTMKSKFYVYKITNKINNKIYIGKGTKNRWKQHFKVAKDGPTNEKFFYLHASIRKYGEENFSCKILEYFENEQDSYNRERELVLKFKSNNKKYGMNLTDGGDGFTSAMMTGKNNPFYGKTHSEESKKKMSEAHIGKDFKTKEGKERQIKAMSGDKNTNAKLAINDVKLIRDNYRKDIWNYKDVMKIYNMGQAGAYRVIFNKTYVDSNYNPPSKRRDKAFYIYKIQNKINNKIFIDSVGQNPDKFWASFKTKKACTLLNNAIKEHGKDNFLFEVFETIYSKDKLYDRVNYWIGHYKSNQEENGYNLKAKTGPSEEGKKKISLANSGKKMSDEHKAIMSATHKGKKKSAAQRKKMSEAQLGEKNHNYGKTASKETRAKMSKTHKIIMNKPII